jgi:nucleoid-associated protein YgaU
MGLFDKMFGCGPPTEAHQDDRFGPLKNKYQSVFDLIDQQNVQVNNLHIEDGKLKIVAVAPSEEAKNRVWDQIKLVDPDFGDLSVNITVDDSYGSRALESYTVKPGDSLWRIAQNKLGNGNRYMEIFYANRDKMDSPQSVIHPGEMLKIPSDLPGEDTKEPWLKRYGMKDEDA